MNSYQIPPEIYREISEHFCCSEEQVLIGPSLSGGRSGDQVYLLTILDPPDLKQAGEYILKIQVHSNQDEFRKEIRNTNSAREKYTSMKVQIPKVQCSSASLGYYVYNVAGTGIKNTSTLYSQTQEKKRSRLEEFVDLSLFACPLKAVSTTPFEIVKCWIAPKCLDGSLRLAENIRKHIHDELTEAWTVNEQILPNPYHYITCTDPEDKNPTLNNALQGPQHGDLNQTNILIQPQDSGFLYSLIDFSHYHSNSFIFFDQAYLLLDILLNIDGMLLTDWIDKLKVFFHAIIDSSVQISSSSDPFDKYASAFIEGSRRFFSRYPENGKTLRIQLLCAFLAAGLNFMHKAKTSDSLQIFSFTFSSLALRELMDIGIGTLPAENNEYPELHMNSAGKIPELWKIVDGFSQKTSRYILISSCLPEHIEPERFCSLSPVPWSAVIEVNQLLENDLRNQALQEFRKHQGYRHILLSKNQEFSPSDDRVLWCSAVIDPNVKNSHLYYTKYIRDYFAICIKNVLSQQEKYPICILVDSKSLDMSVSQEILTEILVRAGNNTMIDIIDLSESEVQIDEEDYIKIHRIPCSLADIARTVQMSFKHDKNFGVMIPSSTETLKQIDTSVLTDIENDMQIIHRKLTDTTDDDSGEAFFHGGEVSWWDLVRSRDSTRIDYKNKWHSLISQNLSRLHSAKSSLMWLYHRPGGGGTTMAKRIMWDFCNLYPTVYLKKISDQTSERIKTLYGIGLNMPLLVITELNSNSISSISLSSLRMDLIRRGVRAQFICVSRINERSNETNNLTFYLPDTPQMYLSAGCEEVCNMYRKFEALLDHEQDHERLADLQDLTYIDERYGDELRQPFFYGLFTFGEAYWRTDNYIQENLSQVNEREKLILEILAFHTVYSQTIHLNIQEISYILFPDRTLNRDIFDQVADILSKNCFVIRRENGYRINHPLIAKKLLERLFGNKGYYNELVDFTKRTVDILGDFYDYNSPRLDNIFHELFIYREPLSETERRIFSMFITELPHDRQRIEIMNYLREKFPKNPHYSNHLARLYLKPQDENQWPDIPNARRFAREAIERADDLQDDSSSIHHHLMGKVYARECTSQFKSALRKTHISSAIKNMNPIYQNAFREFSISSTGRNSSYGLVGKLELINKIFSLICKIQHTSIPAVLMKEESIRTALTEMIAEAGNIIQRYTTNLDETDTAFYSARINFYKFIGKIAKIEAGFNVKASNPQLRVNSRRAIVTVLESNAQETGNVSTYNNLDVKTLTKIKNLMWENIMTDTTDSDSDRFRWLEAYRRLDSFCLPEAYKFVLEWPKASENLDIVYYRYVFAFLCYAQYQDVTYQTVKQHLNQCHILAQKSYGKYTALSRDLLGHLDSENDCVTLVPWQLSELTTERDERERKNKEHRQKKCDFITGSVDSVKEGMVNFRFSMEQTGNSIFYAQAPRIDEAISLLDGQQVKFHLGFSYSGFRAWDISEI